MFCTTCGNQLADGSTVCPSCGAQVQDPIKFEPVMAGQAAAESVATQAQATPESVATPEQAATGFEVSNPQAAQAQPGMVYVASQPATQAQPNATYAANPQAAQAQPGVGYGAVPQVVSQTAQFAPAQDAKSAFPNARSGLRDMWLSQVITLVLGAGLLLLSLLSMVAVLAKNETVATVLGGLTLVFAVVGGIIALVAIVIWIVALRKASKDEQNFRVAFILTILAIVVFVIMLLCWIPLQGAIRSGGYMAILAVIGFLLLAFAILLFIALVMIWRGIISLARKVGRQDVASLGSKLFIIAMVCIVLAYGISLLSVGANFNYGLAMTLARFSGAINVVDSALSLTPNILLLVIIYKAKKMFD